MKTYIICKLAQMQDQKINIKKKKSNRLASSEGASDTTL